MPKEITTADEERRTAKTRDSAAECSEGRKEGRKNAFALPSRERGRETLSRSRNISAISARIACSSRFRSRKLARVKGAAREDGRLPTVIRR